MKNQHESLETLLSKAPYIDDDGFTEALMVRLPPRRPTMRMRAAILLTSTVASCGVVAVVPGARRLLAEIGLGLAGGSAVAGSSFFAIAVVVALLVWGAVAAATSEE